MLKRTIFIGLCFALISPLLKAQNFTLSGYLRDQETGEELLYGSVAVKNTSDGVTTNEYGFYSLTLPAGKYEMVYSYVGYQDQSILVDLNEDRRMDIELGSGMTLEEVVVSSKEADQNVRSTEMSVATLDVKDAKLVPVLFGEQDVLKTIQLLPGVSSNSDGDSGFFVRGGDADQNLILLDEAPVYNASHLLGFFSVFAFSKVVQTLVRAEFKMNFYWSKHLFKLCYPMIMCECPLIQIPSMRIMDRMED